MAGHGPASERDLARWSTLTLTQIRSAIGDLEGVLECLEVDGQALWFDPTVPVRTTQEHAAYLLPTFDEASLTYALTTGFPRREPSSSRPRLVSESGGGVVLLRGVDVGTWKRTVGRSEVRVVVSPDVPFSTADVGAVQDAAARLAAFVEKPADVEVRAIDARR